MQHRRGGLDKAVHPEIPANPPSCLHCCASEPHIPTARDLHDPMKGQPRSSVWLNTQLTRECLLKPQSEVLYLAAVIDNCHAF